MTDRWDPWRELEARPHLTHAFLDLPPATGGALYARRGHRGVVLLDSALEPPARDAALTHELVHDERGGGCDFDGDHWQPVVAREETRVRRITAERLVPTADLQRFCDCQADMGHGVGPDDVVVEFDVSWHVARDALDNLTRYERGTR